MAAASSSRGPQSKRWCFTVNNPGEWRPLYMPEIMDYICWELEHAADAVNNIPAGTPHIQGYVRFKARKYMAAAKELIHHGAHMEPAKGTEQQNKTYCSKEGLLVEQGVFDASIGARNNQGARTDIADAIDKLKAGTNRQTVFMEHLDLIVKYPAGMEKAAEVTLGLPPITRDIHNTVLFGETGTGKSHRAHTAYPDAYSGTVGVGTFDKYNGEEVIILDEFEPTLVPIQELLMWLDKWKTQVKCRYVNRWARWTKVIILSNVEPRLWYSMEHPPQREALRRRLDWPMGQVFECLSKEQEINLHWMDALTSAPAPAVQILGRPDAPGSSIAQPAPVHSSPLRTAPPLMPPPTPLTRIRRPHPSPSTSPSTEPPQQRMRSLPLHSTYGGTSDPSVDMDADDVIGFNPDDPLIID